jgi:ribonuclease-3
MASETITAAQAEVLEACQQALGYRFEQPELLRAALTHASGANSRLASNERLEFLGDAILGMIACEQLYHRFPDFQEGELTRIKSDIVSRRTCAGFCTKLGLGRFLFLGRGMNAQEMTSVPTGMLADLYESLVAAIYLDGGLEAAREFVLRQLSAEIEAVAGGHQGNNYKSQLQQVAQREYNMMPQYLVLDEKGPDHSKCFLVAAVIGGHTHTGAWGRSKKEAEQRAARNALAEIYGQELPFDNG